MRDELVTEMSPCIVLAFSTGKIVRVFYCSGTAEKHRDVAQFASVAE